MTESTIERSNDVLNHAGTTDREAADLFRAQSREIAQLAGWLAHEIRNPLSTMRLNLDLVAEEIAEADGPRERRVLAKIERIQKESVRLECLVEDFLRLVRASELRKSRVDLAAVVDDLRDFCEPQAAPQGVVMRTRFDPELPEIDLDVDMFKQALFNLIRNALAAMPDGGELILETRKEGDSAILEVTDTGKGIPKELQPRVFEPFFSTKPGGSGLGLPTSRRVVVAHGGSITLESEPGKGSRFRVALPITPREASDVESRSSSNQELSKEQPEGR